MSIITIRKGSVDEVYALAKAIPEFEDLYPKTVFVTNLGNNKALILIAEIENIAVGFKAGYEQQQDGSFFSWMGGVFPEFRGKGVARKLANYMEEWAIKEGFSKIKMTTRNRNKAMLIFAVSNSFNLTSIEERSPIGENRLFLEKEL